MSSKMRPWAERSNTIGFVPGKKSTRKEALRQILRQLPVSHRGSITVTMASGEEVEVPADNICGNQLSRGALACREPSGQWVASEAATQWLRTSDDDALACHLHANVKLFGELLAHLDGVRTKSELLSLSRDYGLHWTSTDQLYRRISWMEALGLVERWGTNKFVMTDSGKVFLAKVELTPQSVAVGTDSTQDESDLELPPAGEAVAALLNSLSQQQLQKRKTLVGYIPRGRKAPDRDSDAGSRSPFESIRTLVEVMGDGASTEEFYQRCISQLGMKRTSAIQTLQTMRHMKLFELVSYNQYGTASDVPELLELGNELDFIRLMHVRYKFFGELLATIPDTTPVTHMVRVANENYGLRQIENSEVRTRLGFMLEAGLVERIDWTRYRSTALGKLLASELTLEHPRATTTAAGESPATTVEDESTTLESVISRLRDFARRSDASRELEVAIADAFSFLGFHTQHLGGSGRTDVVADALLPDKGGYRVIIDAKSSATGVISDNHVKFDALKEHQRKHRADFGMVVGPSFAERVRDWAILNKFTLLAVEDLVGLLQRHSRFPLALPDLRLLFERSGDDLTDVEEQYAESERNASLLTKLVELLYTEAREEDPLMGGYISRENINYALRKELTPRPSTKAVEECLQFLAHELVRGAVQEGTRYKLADAPANIMRRLAGLGADLETLTSSDL